MKHFILYLWQLPQNLLGLVLLMFWKEKTRLSYKGKTIHICESFPRGISLGNTIIVRHYPFSTVTWNYVKHEYGHSRQSEYLGLLYLIVIGLPSLCGNIYDRMFDKGNEWYYNQPWEKGADKLGGVNR